MRGVELHFGRWLGVESSNFDQASVEVSNDGTNWTAAWTHGGGSISDTSWTQMVLDISAVADGAATLYFRWSMGPTDSSVTYPGWNIDDVEIWAIPAGPSSTTIVSAASCLDHGGTPYCLDLPLGGGAAVEPRLGGVVSLSLVTVDPVQAGGTTASATCLNNVYAGVITVTSAGTTNVSVALDALPDGDCCTIDFAGGIVDSVNVRTMEGDVNGDGSVTTADVTAAKQRLGSSTDGANYTHDVNTDGGITTADVTAIKQRLGLFAPACP
ncbi:MAG: dockerin type I domain-containing protein [Anaerolineae bacterium]